MLITVLFTTVQTRSDDTKYITVDNRKFKLTADTAVLLVDSDADDDDQIGVSFTYGSTAMAKAEEYLSGGATQYPTTYSSRLTRTARPTTLS